MSFSASIGQAYYFAEKAAVLAAVFIHSCSFLSEITMQRMFINASRQYLYSGHFLATLRECRRLIRLYRVGAGGSHVVLQSAVQTHSQFTQV